MLKSGFIMLNMNGTWLANYAALTSPIGEPEPDEAATLELSDGRITGKDPWGGIYDGTYTQSGENWSASIEVTTDDPDAITVFDGVAYPLKVEASGQFRSPDYFSGTGLVNNKHQIIFNCKRLED